MIAWARLDRAMSKAPLLRLLLLRSLLLRSLLRSFNAQRYLMSSTMIDEAETSGWFSSTSGSAAPTPGSGWLEGTMKCSGSGVSYII